MRKIKITNRSIAKLEKRLLKVVKDNYQGDKSLYCYVDNVKISQLEDFLVTYTICYGKEEKDSSFQETIELVITNQNLNFIAGQFFQLMLEREE